MTNAHGCVGAADRVPRELAKFGTAEWDWKFGDHRAVVRVTSKADVVVAYLPWRRRDAHPETKNVLVIAADTGKEVSNRAVLVCNKEYGEVAFQPATGQGLYHLYYLQPIDDANAFAWPRWVLPITRYVPPRDTAETQWLAKHRLTTEDLRTLPLRPESAGDAVFPAHWRALPQAELVEFQARGEWNSFFPMEVIATLDERLALEERCRFRPFIIFPESRRNPIRMTEALPCVWAIRAADALDRFADTVLRNEYYVFQIGVYAFKEMLPYLKATWTDLTHASGTRIPAGAITCFNLEGSDQCGNRFSKTVHVERGKVQALWFGIDIPESIRPGRYQGTVTIVGAETEPQSVELQIEIEDKVLSDRGDGDHWRLSRLRWLNSRLGLDDDVCAPFTPVQARGRTINILGRTIEIGPDGLPVQITSRIDMFEIRETGRAILAKPVAFEAIGHGGTRIDFLPRECRHVSSAPGAVRYAGEGRAGNVVQRLETTVEMDGFIGCRVTLQAETDLALETVRLTVPLASDVAKYVLGVGAEKPMTSPCPAQARTSLEKFDLVWVGDYNAGLALTVAEARASWVNRSAGYCRHERQGAIHAVVLESGALVLQGGVPRSFGFELYATPFKPLPRQHWNWRYYHAAYGNEPDVKSGLAAGARIVTVHHGCRAHPYISYPFLVAPGLRAVADEVHRAGCLFKAYYTIGELSTRAPELWALRSLGNEILTPAHAWLGYEELSQLPLEYQLRRRSYTGTGQTWMCEHLVSNYNAKWHSVIAGPRRPPLFKGDTSVEFALSKDLFVDSSVGISGASRWANFYLEGLRWLMTHAGLDGLYLDGFSFGREAFKRVRKVLVRQKPEALIDYHGSPGAMAQLPYLDSLWFGEGADYSRDPDYWLVAVSGIPFGVPGELLLEDASVQRGMVYGLCQRYGWWPVDPSGLWKWWDEFGIESADMRGYWMENCPVTTSDPAVRATAYVHYGKQTAVAIASWAPEKMNVKIDLDWAALGLDPQHVRASVPAIPEFQEPLASVNLEALPVMPGKGWIVVIRQA